MDKRTIIIGGGTFNHIRNHLSLAAPAYGTTAKQIHSIYQECVRDRNSELVLTRMADPNSNIVTNGHLSNYIDTLIEDNTVGTIIMNAAVCDFTGDVINEHLEVEPGPYAQRLKTADGPAFLELTPSDKIIGKIRKARPDIFLVGFKTTTGASEEEQFEIALKMMKSSKCNLVLANDVVTRCNMIITPEETRYHVTTDRYMVLDCLVEMTVLRDRLTYHRTQLDKNLRFAMGDTPESFQTVIQFLIDNGGFIENNGNGFTPGHFCWLDRDKGLMYSSQRKVNHNDVFNNIDGGLTCINVYYVERVAAFGSRKPSVGATSQQLLLQKLPPQFDCIVHTHNPLKESSELHSVPQYAYQCGSLECGMNTANNVRIFNYKGSDLAAVYLEKHGINLVFRSDQDPENVIDFLKENIELGVKVS